MKEMTLIFVDANFLKLVSKNFGSIKYDLKIFLTNLTDNLNLEIEKIFYYDAPPYKSFNSTNKEKKKTKNFYKFKCNLEKKEIIVKLGKCQKIIENGKVIFKQKQVDILLSNDLAFTPLDFPKIKKIILITSDSDFIPTIKKINQRNVKTILYTYFEKKKDTKFSSYNSLFKNVYKYILIKKDDFKKAEIKK
jgi:uncharacterized LabA/DUF88 family protein